MIYTARLPARQAKGFLAATDQPCTVNHLRHPNKKCRAPGLQRDGIFLKRPTAYSVPATFLLRIRHSMSQAMWAAAMAVISLWS